MILDKVYILSIAEDGLDGMFQQPDMSETLKTVNHMHRGL